MDLEISKESYNLKIGGYYVFAKSPTSIYTHFSIDVSSCGKIANDFYEIVFSENSIHGIEST